MCAALQKIPDFRREPVAVLLHFNLADSQHFEESRLRLRQLAAHIFEGRVGKHDIGGDIRVPGNAGSPTLAPGNGAV